METNAKSSLYNTSSYGQRQSQKQAIYNNSKFGLAQSAIAASNSSDTKTKKYTMSDGRVLVRPAASNRIDFKSLFGSITTDDADCDVTQIITSMKKTSESYMDAYTKMSKQRLGFS